jgi:GH15 family glucan-1,4-alpha-glucosidase
MGRPVVLSNGQVFVGLDENGLVHDFYYPYVGLENLTNARSLQHKIGIWVDGAFSWTNDGSWEIKTDFEPQALISIITMRSAQLDIELALTDFVDSDYNALIRRVTVTNASDTERDVRLFMHQVFQISNAGRADTAMYVPEDHYVLDYKGRCCLLIAGRTTDGDDFDQYCVGNYGIEGKAGTYMDAEDGELTGNAVEHGGVDSVIRFRKSLAGGDSFTADYWLIAADSQSDGQAIHQYYKERGISERLEATQNYWQAWIEPSLAHVAGLSPDQQVAALKSSLIIKAHCDERGSILASGDSTIFNYGRDYYCYCWPRDSAFALWPLLRLGHTGEARAFFDFARDTMHVGGYLMHKYQPDRAIGSTWHPLLHGRQKELAIQEDETASVVYMMGEYYRLTQDKAFLLSFYDTFIAPAAGFMCEYVDDVTGLPHASYDLWEQKFSTSTYTVCTVIAALETASHLAVVADYPDDSVRFKRAAQAIRGNLDKLYHPDGYFRKGILLQEDESIAYDDSLDISNLYGPYMFARLALDDERLISTAQHVVNRLQNTSPIGGVVRYEHDDYFLSKQQYKGNPWIVCSLWLAQYLDAAGQKQPAEELMQWAMDRRLDSGVLAEQFDPENGQPLIVVPLVWSHAELINTLLDLYSK